MKLSLVSLFYVAAMASSTMASDFCDNGAVGSGLCQNASLCCSKWGWCGSISTHCDPATCVSGPGCPISGGGAPPTMSPTSAPVEVNSTAAPTSSPPPPPTKSPSNQPTKSPTANPTHGPTPVPTETPTKQPLDGGQEPVVMCGNGVVGSGLCQDPSQCCSGWGWCSSLSAHCAADTCFSSPDNSCARPEAVFHDGCGGGGSNPNPTPAPTSKPATPAPTPAPTNEPTASPVPPTNPGTTNAPTPVPTRSPTSPTPPTTGGVSGAVENVLEASKDGIDNKLFLFETPAGQWEPSTVYRYSGLLAGLRVMYQKGINGKFFYMGDDSSNGHEYGLVNIASFLAQSMKETIKYNACDENSWDLVNGVYPLSNACGQLGQSYQDYHCSEEEAYMECPVDPNMSITATTNAKWYGAPGPLKCGPKTEIPAAGFWDHTAECNQPWADPPEYCTAYDGQKAGKENNDNPVSNVNGRDDVEGCCWWGRGVIQSTGVCNFGKLNFFLGKRAANEGRESAYPTIDFCQDPGAICASQEFTELKWIAGMFYWMESVQSYDVGGWNYMTELRKFVDGGMADDGFVDAVSGIVNRGCHDPPCSSGSVDGGADRRSNFRKVISEFGLSGGSRQLRA